ncbi:PapB/FocB family fimbrial expression transcriptional regulator, partial [Providencia rustigianii]
FNKDEYLFREKPGWLVKGRVNKGHFKLLIELSQIRSSKSIYALEEYLVKGKELKDVCNECDITPSKFTNSLRKLQKISQSVIYALPYYRG